MLLDAKNMIMGRLASFAAKEALKGGQIDVVNAELAVITGTKHGVYEKYRKKRG